VRVLTYGAVRNETVAIALFRVLCAVFVLFGAGLIASGLGHSQW
jgi:hypothetical protein